METPPTNMEKEIQAYAAVVHGFLAFGHLLGIIYNIRRHNRWDTIIHTIALAYDFDATLRHIRHARHTL